jgi:hypothetical protein
MEDRDIKVHYSNDDNFSDRYNLFLERVFGSEPVNNLVTKRKDDKNGK